MVNRYQGIRRISGGKEVRLTYDTETGKWVTDCTICDGTGFLPPPVWIEQMRRGVGKRVCRCHPDKLYPED